MREEDISQLALLCAVCLLRCRFPPEAHSYSAWRANTRANTSRALLFNRGYFWCPSCFPPCLNGGEAREPTTEIPGIEPRRRKTPNASKSLAHPRPCNCPLSRRCLALLGSGSVPLKIWTSDHCLQDIPGAHTCRICDFASTACLVGLWAPHLFDRPARAGICPAANAVSLSIELYWTPCWTAKRPALAPLVG